MFKVHSVALTIEQLANKMEVHSQKYNFPPSYFVRHPYFFCLTHSSWLLLSVCTLFLGKSVTFCLLLFPAAFWPMSNSYVSYVHQIFKTQCLKEVSASRNAS